MPKKKQTLKKKSEFGRIFDFFYTVLGLIFITLFFLFSNPIRLDHSKKEFRT